MSWMGHPIVERETEKSNCRFLHSRWSVGMTALGVRAEQCTSEPIDEKPGHAGLFS